MTVNKIHPQNNVAVHTETGGAHISTTDRVGQILETPLPDLKSDPVFQRHLADIQHARGQSLPKRIQQEVQPTYSPTLAEVYARIFDINKAMSTEAKIEGIADLLYYLLTTFGIYPDKSTGKPKSLSLLWKGWSILRGTYLDKIDEHIIGKWEGIYGRKVIAGDYEKIARRLYQEEVGRELYPFMKLLSKRKVTEKEVRIIIERPYPDLNQTDTAILNDAFNACYSPFLQEREKQFEQEATQQRIQGDQVIKRIDEAEGWLRSISPEEKK